MVPTMTPNPCRATAVPAAVATTTGVVMSKLFAHPIVLSLLLLILVPSLTPDPVHFHFD